MEAALEVVLGPEAALNNMLDWLWPGAAGAGRPRGCEVQPAAAPPGKDAAHRPSRPQGRHGGWGQLPVRVSFQIGPKPPGAAWRALSSASGGAPPLKLQPRCAPPFHTCTPAHLTKALRWLMAAYLWSTSASASFDAAIFTSAALPASTSLLEPMVRREGCGVLRGLGAAR